MVGKTARFDKILLTERLSAHERFLSTLRYRDDPGNHPFLFARRRHHEPGSASHPSRWRLPARLTSPTRRFVVSAGPKNRSATFPAHDGHHIDSPCLGVDSAQYRVSRPFGMQGKRLLSPLLNRVRRDHPSIATNPGCARTRAIQSLIAGNRSRSNPPCGARWV